VVGRTISHYKILDKIGEGGMGVVYKAEDLNLQRIVALKFLPSNVVTSDGAKARFLCEARAAAALQHSNICTVHEVGEADGQPFIAMAFVDGEELSDEIEKGPLELDKLVDVATQIARGLEEAHGKGVVHRDIKPANIMLASGGHAVLMDFGLAQLNSAKSKLTREGTTMGTSAYMSPEQTTGDEVDHRSDIWALGVLLYEMATGQLPFRGHYEQAVLYSILNESPELLSAMREGVPAELQRIVSKCLAKDCGVRYQNAADLIADLNTLKRASDSGATTLPPGGSADDPPSIAVLAFENRNRGDEDEYFSEGISEDITSALVKLKRLRVAPRSLAFQYKGTRPTPEEVGRKLNVGHVLEGSVRRSGDRVRINVELIAIDEGYEVWSERYDRVMEDIFEIQDEISQAVVDQLKIKLLPGEEEILSEKYTRNLKAYNLCLRGRFHWYQRNVGALQEAMTAYQQALAEDSEYALAHAGIADCYNSFSFYGVLPAKEAMPKAEAAAGKALQIDPNLATAHVSLGAVEAMFRWNWPAADREFRRAIELDPSNALAHFWYALWTLAPMGRLDEADSETLLAIELDPVTTAVNCGPGIVRVMQRLPDLAIQELQRALQLDPNFYMAHLVVGFAYIRKGDFSSAIAALDREGPPVWRDPYLGYAYAGLGETDKARNLLTKLESESSVEQSHAFGRAVIHFGLGEIEPGLDCLEQACDEHSSQFFHVAGDVAFDVVREHPRFQAIRRRMNLAE
jgi:serine/threonine protein kinase/tetratricopeptide (TPR) repeat protein